MFASASSVDEPIKIWNETALKCIANLDGRPYPKNSLIFLRNEYLISISSDKTIKIPSDGKTLKYD